MWIVYDEDNNLEVHYFVRCFPTSCYMGYFRAFYSDGDLVGIMNFSDRQELLTLERNSDGTISFTRQGFYTSNGGEDYEQTSTLEKTASLSSLPEDHYIESFTGMWIDFDNTNFLSSVNITKIDPKTLEARVYEHCTPDNCYWGIDQSSFYPGGASFDLTNLNGDELSLDISLTETGRLHVEWNLAYEGGGVAAGTQTLVKIIYL